MPRRKKRPQFPTASAGGGEDEGERSVVRPAHRDACFRLLHLNPKSDLSLLRLYPGGGDNKDGDDDDSSTATATVSMKNLWAMLTSPSATSESEVGGGGEEEEEEDSLEDSILSALLLLRLLKLREQQRRRRRRKRRNEKARLGKSRSGSDDEDEDEDDDDEDDNGYNADLRRNLVSDLLQVRRYLQRSIRDPMVKKRAAGAGAADGIGSPDANRGDAKKKSLLALPPIRSVLQVVARLAKKLEREVANRKEKGAPPPGPPTSLSFLSERDANGVRDELLAVAGTVASQVDARYDWGRVWDAAMSKPTATTATFFGYPSDYNRSATTATGFSSPSPSVHWQVLTWQWSCYLSSSTSSSCKAVAVAGDASNRRRARRVASCAAVAFAVALGQLQQQAGEKVSSSSSRRASSGGSSKRAKTESPIGDIVDASNDTDARSRWRQPLNVALLMGDRNVDDNEDKRRARPVGDDDEPVSVEEVKEMVGTLVAAVWKETAVLRQEIFDGQHRKPPANAEDKEWDTSRAPKWVRESVVDFIPEQNGIDPLTTSTVLRYLPQTTYRLYYSSFDTETAYLDQVQLVESMDSLKALAGGMELPDPQAQKLGTAGGGTPTSTVSRRAVTPPVYTEVMHAHEWIVALLSLDVVRPSPQLIGFLQEADSKSSMLSVVGRGTAVLLKEYSNMAMTGTTNSGGGREDNSCIQVSSDTGQVFVNGDSKMTADTHACKAVAALYYHALEAILYREQVFTNDEKISDGGLRVVKNASFFRAVFSCCTVCVIKALTTTKVLRSYLGSKQEEQDMVAAVHMPVPVLTILNLCQCNPYDVLVVSDAFCNSMTQATARGNLQSPLMFPFPRLLVNEIRHTKGLLLDSLAWVRVPGSMGMADWIEALKKLGPKSPKNGNAENDSASLQWWPPEILVRRETDLVLEKIEPSDCKTKSYPSQGDDYYEEYRNISRLLRDILGDADARIRALCNFLGIPPLSPVQTQVNVAFQYLLRHHVDVFYNRHMDPLILCCLYGVGKSMRHLPDLRFARIIDAYVAVRGQDLGDVTCQRIVRHVRLTKNGASDDAPIGNVILLYNNVFVRRMKDYLLNNPFLKHATEALREINMSSETPLEAASHLASTTPMKESFGSTGGETKRVGPNGDNLAKTEAQRGANNQRTNNEEKKVENGKEKES